jgi:two-component system chemotaxis response regulator CheB
MISTLTTSRSKVTLKALELGAFDFIAKPNLSNQRNLLDFKREVLSKIKTVEKVKMKNILDTVRLRSISEVSHSGKINNLNRNIIGIGVSTGGVQTLKKLLPSFPSNIPGMLIVQHMPREFTLSFARMLNNVSGIEIKEAESGDEVLGGRALLAPGDSHLELQKIKNRYFVKLNRREKVNHQRPSVDVTFNSLAEVAGSKTIGVLLTGMGTDGARGMLNIKKAGGYTIAQNEETAIVYGMPRAAVELNAANEILPLAEISEKIEKLINEVK